MPTKGAYKVSNAFNIFHLYSMNPNTFKNKCMRNNLEEKKEYHLKCFSNNRTISK